MKTVVAAVKRKAAAPTTHAARRCRGRCLLGGGGGTMVEVEPHDMVARGEVVSRKIADQSEGESVAGEGFFRLSMRAQ